MPGEEWHMENASLRINELIQQGFCCSQILVIMGLESQEKENPDLVRAAHGLCGGIGSSGGICGSLTGGACLLGLFAGRGDINETANRQFGLMLDEMANWFNDKIGKSYGGILCSEILADGQINKPFRCPGIITDTWQKVKELLITYGYDLAW